MDRNQTLKRILERDNHLCGIHYGGCGKEIKLTDSANIDHIIPKTLRKSKGNQGDSVFMKDYFRQPMHTKCNSIDKRGQLTTYPEFTCDCHYTYYNVETETVEIYFQHYFKHNDTFEWRKETFLENFINHKETGVGHIMSIGRRGTVHGFQRGNDMGSIFKQYKYSDRYICYLMNIYSLLKCKRLDEAKQEYAKYIEFIDTTDSHPRPDTLDKVTEHFGSLSGEDDTSELANKILYILNPKTYHLRVGLKKCQSGDTSEGIRHLHKSLELGTDKDQDATGVFSDLGYAYINIGRYEEAKKYLLKSIKLDSNNKYAKGNLAYLYEVQGQELLEAKKYQLALNFFLKAKDVLYNSVAIHTLITFTYSKLGNLVYAIRYAKEGLKIAPDTEILKQTLHELEVAEQQKWLLIKGQKYVWSQTSEF